MKRILLILTAVIAPVFLAAKGPVVKIMIEGLEAPVTITDPAILDFSPFAGPTTGFIIKWQEGTVAEPPANLPLYDVAFYVNDPPSAYLAYVAKYVFDPSSSSGYVYLTGPSDPQYKLNHMRYGSALDGHWVRANPKWQSFVLPFLRGRVSQ